MIAWAESLGYTFKGMCGCRTNKKVYDNGTGWQLWITQNEDKMEVRQIFGRDSILRGIGNHTNYKGMYEYTLNKYKRQL